mmetsp:Transcript_4488/g.17666  ORF Transcript_4488/g.17666 Transcript_4488/m.17666 type:complete len:204 (+) Transcript_4488:636-1247(+)
MHTDAARVGALRFTSKLGKDTPRWARAIPWLVPRVALELLGDSALRSLGNGNRVHVGHLRELDAERAVLERRRGLAGVHMVWKADAARDLAAHGPLAASRRALAEMVADALLGLRGLRGSRGVLGIVVFLAAGLGLRGDREDVVVDVEVHVLLLEALRDVSGDLDFVLRLHEIHGDVALREVLERGEAVGEAPLEEGILKHGR